MRILLVLIALSISLRMQGQTRNSSQSLKFDRVVIYDYEPKGENPNFLNNQNQIIKGVLVKKQVTLDKATINKLNLELTNKKSYGGNYAMCFEPHLAVVYFLKERPIQNVIICLHCNRLTSSFPIPQQLQGKVGKGEKAYYTREGLSKSFRFYLNNLLKKYQFSNQINPGSDFDK